ncbi:MAG: hypothetical protein NPIRA06_20270 [Nitrospirales bacterium]|nr:MAG: hypothetical protein NPIRA06_20270 [Nitrospirales bacterium]
MQRLDLINPELPDIQFVLMVLALCTSDLETMNAPHSVRETVFNRCWALMHESPPPVKAQERVLDLTLSDEITLEALVHVIRQTFEEQGFVELTWDHPPSEPTRDSTPEARPLVDRLQQWEPPPDNSNPPASSN